MVELFALIIKKGRYIMNGNKIKTMLDKEVLNSIEDHSTAAILKSILFNDNNKIDWGEVYKIIMGFKPELAKFDGYKPENMG